MSKKEKDENAPKYVGLKRFQKHMLRSKDITLLILKGHLLVEQEMNDILDDNLTESKAVLEARISFSHRLAIIKSIYGQVDNQMGGVYHRFQGQKYSRADHLELIWGIPE
ncbi:hypothetical protein ACFLV4_06425 [Chloroflexota bacterium]